MKHFTRLLAPIAFCLIALPATAEKLSLDSISGYLNNLKTARTAFTQINEDGSKTTGELLIRRPGGMRFEYSPPETSLVMAGGGQVAIFDAKSNQPPQRFPLNKTPLNLILARNVDLAKAKMVVGHTSDGQTTTITAQDPKHPENGYIELVFTNNPTELRQWVVTDGSGQQTTVVLDELKKGEKLGAGLFNIRREMSSRGF